MRLAMKLEDYLDAFLGSEQVPVSLGLILQPFGFFYTSDPDASLLTGLFLMSLTSEYQKDDWIDPVDIASSALSLGYEPAHYFLEEAPWLMRQAIRRGHISLASNK